MLLMIYDVIFIGLICFLTYYVLCTMAPILLAMAFMLMVCVSVYFNFSFVDALMAYMLFLVYVGGLLVLIMYMMMVSSNFLSSNYYVSTVLLLFMVVFTISVYMLFNTCGEMKNLAGAEMLCFSNSSLIVLGAVLLYVFFGVCTSIIVGGRTLAFGS